MMFMSKRKKKKVAKKVVKLIGPKVIAKNPLTVSEKYKRFIEATEGKENKGGDPRANELTKTKLPDEDRLKWW